MFSSVRRHERHRCCMMFILMVWFNIQVVAAGANPVLITRGIEKTTKGLVNELKSISKEVM